MTETIRCSFFSLRLSLKETLTLTQWPWFEETLTLTQWPLLRHTLTLDLATYLGLALGLGRLLLEPARQLGAVRGAATLGGERERRCGQRGGCVGANERGQRGADK
jgi:hypothetical protein